MKNPILFFIMLVFTALNIIDLITASFIGAAEANPLYLLFGNFIVVDILKIGLVALFWFWYVRGKFPSQFAYYNTILILLIANVALIVAVTSNIYVILHPATLHNAATVPAVSKAKDYGIFVLFMVVIPYICSLLVFKLWEWSIKKVKIRPKYFDKWYKI